jgi:hypothetical protein
MRPLAALAVVFLAASCAAIEGPVACDTYGAYSINVKLQDSVTKATTGMRRVWVRAAGTSVASMGVSDSAFVEVLNQPFPVAVVMERTGSFLVTVSASGYKPWRSSVTVHMKDQCHVQGEVVTALLQPYEMGSSPPGR